MFSYEAKTATVDPAELYAISTGLMNVVLTTSEDEQSRASAVTVTCFVNVSTGKPPAGCIEH